jgi:hypothetical protein
MPAASGRTRDVRAESVRRTSSSAAVLPAPGPPVRTTRRGTWVAVQAQPLMTADPRVLESQLLDARSMRRSIAKPERLGEPRAVLEPGLQVADTAGSGSG